MEFTKSSAVERFCRDSRNRELGNLAAALFEHNERLFSFLEYDGVEPTNNSAERVLRTGVQWRKICFGNSQRRR